MKSLLLVMCLGSLAVAEPAGGGKATPAPPPTAAPEKITGDKAKVLMRALKLAGVKAKTSQTKSGFVTTSTFAAKTISCRSKPESDDGFGTTECQVDARKVINAEAVVLESAMKAAEIIAPFRIAESLIQATALTCIHDEAYDEDEPFVCTYTTPP